MTSVITKVVYGSRPKATILRRGNRLPIAIPVENLPRYVAQASAERSDAPIEAADVELPAEILRLGFCFVDTPGVGSAIVANTETTRRFLPQADAVIFVTSFDSPLTEAEVAFLRDVQSDVKRIFVVLNKRDLVGADEERQVETFVRSRITETGLEAPDIFRLSARDALAAKERGDVDALLSSGLATFEAALVDYLTAEKAREFLLRVGERATRFVDAISSEAAIAGTGPDRAAIARRVDEKLTPLLAGASVHRQDLLHTLAERSDRALDALERDASAHWSATLHAVVMATLGTSAPRRRVHGSRDLESLEAVSRDVVGHWSDERAAAWLNRLERASDPTLEELAGIPNAIESQMAMAFGTTAPAPLAADEQQRPYPTAGSVPWTLAPAPAAGPWWQSLRAPELDDLVARAVERHVERLAGRVRTATEDWLASLDRWSEDEVSSTAVRVRARLGTPADAELGDELAALSRAIAASRARVASWPTSERTRAAPATAVPARPEPMERGTGCVVCARLVRTLFDFMAQYQFALATRLEQRIAHAAGGGFCPTHTWYYAEIGSPIGISASYARVGEHVAAVLRAAAEADDLTALRTRLRDAACSQAQCPACRRLAECHTEMLGNLRDALANGGAVPPLCVGHASDLLDHEADLDRARRVAEATASRLARRAEDMRTYALKRESLRQALIDREEADAYEDVLVRLVGDPLLVRPRRTEEQ